MASLKDKVVVITGASAGIGAACAVKFAKLGSRLVLHGRNEDSLQEVVEQCLAAGAEEGITKEHVVTVLGDLSEDIAVENIIKTTLDTFGTIHVLFNNAGYVSPKEGPLSVSGGVEGLDDMYRIVLRVPYMLVQGFVPELVKSKGVVINGSSGYSKVVDPTMTAYSTMKAAMDHFTQVLAIELGMRGVRVNSVNPGWVKTSIGRVFGDAAEAFWESRNSMVPLEHKMATPDDIANVVVFLASDEAAAMTGSIVLCDKGSTLTHSAVDFNQFK